MSINLVTSTFFLFFLPNLFSVSIARDTLTPSQSLSGNETLVSAAGTFALGFFTPSADSNKQYLGIWYNNISIQTVVWVANRQNPVIGSNGTLSISNEGTLLVTGINSTIIWSSGVDSGATSPSAQLLDNGNFFVRAVNSSTNTEIVTWQSFDYPTNTLLPGMRLGWDLKTRLNRNLTSWAAATDPSPGPYVVYIDIRGDPQLVIDEGSNWFWRGGPWDGERFTGIPEMETHNAFNFSFVDNSDDIYYTYNIIDDAILSRVIVDQFGTCQRLVWLEQSKIWNVFWAVPQDNCDGISLCGPFGVCNANDSPICNCLQGFVPKLPYDWSLRDGTGGCIRKTPLNCKRGTDGFLTVNGAKLPDTSTATVNWNIGLDDCRQVCLDNCSCTAYASANISGSGSGCIIWTQNITDLRAYDDGGQDLYVRLAAADLGRRSTDLPQVQSHWSRLATVIIMAGTVSIAFLLACVGFFICRRKKKIKRAMSIATSFKDRAVEGKEFELPLFDIDTIVLATNNFCAQNKLGEGGFGPVYKGKLGGQEIAVKRLARSSVQGVEEFKNEVMLIAKLQHRNLVRLLGCCIEEEERILVYEYMPNKSLDAFLFANATSLDWQTRYHIISGIARGLLYLHHESRLRIIHRDLKASNILLDKDMNPKISDFGMARISGGDDAEVNTIKVVGTYGYMAPEYAMDGTFSVKSDVFSFGVLVLEIISGKKNRGIFLEEPHLNLLGFAWNLWNEGNGLDLVDDTICHSFPILEALTCIKVGLLCVQARPEDRPTLSSVVFMLGSDHAALPRPKQPGFVAKKYRFDADFSSAMKKSLTVNGLTITALGGR